MYFYLVMEGYYENLLFYKKLIKLTCFQIQIQYLFIKRLECALEVLIVKACIKQLYYEITKYVYKLKSKRLMYKAGRKPVREVVLNTESSNYSI